jgi:ATP-binding protein involved in chromosome partitioning
MAEEYGLPYLGALPLDRRIREDTDSGRPTVVADPDGAVAKVYIDIARRAAGRLAAQKKDYSAKFPSIVIQNS